MTNEVSVEEAIDVFKIMKRQVLEDSREDKVLDIAIKALETASCIKEKCAYCPHCENCDVDDETLEIKTLEQQPCEDCISRQAVLDIINFEDEWLHDANSHNADTKIAFHGLESRVKELPSVTPKAESEE